MTDCIFCDIIAERAPASVVYSDGLVLATMDIGPVNPGHVLVMPKDHVARMAEMDEELGMHLFRIAMRVAAALPGSGVECEGINIFLANRETAFQEVPHIHLHVFPRFTGDDFKIEADWSSRPSRRELDGLVDRIRSSYAALFGV
jgi:histidine triad (HIT) family protein